MLISLSGGKRVGKDTIADILVSKFGYTKIALADPLRELCSFAFNISLDTFLSDELKEKTFERPVVLTSDILGQIEAIIECEWGFEVTEAAHNAMCEFIGYTFAHPRHILQTIGTEIIRGNIDDNIFLKLADKRISKLGDKVVVSDVRFFVEQEWAKNKGMLMVLIKRPTLNLPKDKHISENQLDNEDIYNTIITNDDTLDHFKHEVFGYFSEIIRRRGKN